MHKKILTGFVLSIVLMLGFTFCYAENKNAENMMNNAGNAIQGAAGTAGNMVKGATNSIKNGAQNLGNTISDGANKAGNAMENGVNNIKSSMNNDNNNNMNANNNNDGNYTATRTAGEGTLMGISNNTWSWLILGIAAIAIIALVWSYSAQLNNNRRNDE